ncbi:MAG: Na+-transporting NADH:ubiquinone oxidoreductase subunit A [Bradymonadia bacterium]|jgi:Na+-transporting NADH:ubiquinone oxidoreductase subunit A
MTVHVIKRGLDLPIEGAPSQSIEPGAPLTRVALVADDYPFMRARMAVNVGDTVKRGQLLFEDRKAEGVRFTAPAAGTISAIHRGARRALQTVVIELSNGEKAGKPGTDELVKFENHSGKPPSELTPAQVKALLVESGMWTAIRKRPFNQVPAVESECAAIFVNAMDTSPLAVDPAIVLREQGAALKRGMQAVAKLTQGPVFFVKAKGAALDPGTIDRLRVEEFTGKHPAGLVGTHIHTLFGASRERVVWHLSAADVVRVGELFETGILPVETVVALAGPAVKSPRLVKTRLGACIDELTAGQLTDGETRTVSGSVLHGRTAAGEIWGFLSRYSLQISVLSEDRERVFLGWLKPGNDKFSVTRAFTAGLLGKKKGYDFTTTTHGSHRAMVPIGMFEKVMPLDIMPTFLLRALAVSDLDRAEALGCMELDEEDLSLCNFVSPGKNDFAVDLRRVLTTIWKEG